MAQRKDPATPVKDAVGNALLELMQHKPLKKISAGEIASRAGLGRVTYFRHFSSKEEVLVYKYRAEWQDFAAHHWYDQEDDRANAIALFRFCARVRDINDVVYAAGQENTLLAVVLDTFAGTLPGRAPNPATESGTAVDIRTRYARGFKAYGLFGLIDAWIRGGYRETPEEMATEYLTCLNPEIESPGSRGGVRRTGGRAARMRRLERIREARATRSPHPHILD